MPRKHSLTAWDHKSISTAQHDDFGGYKYFAKRPQGCKPNFTNVNFIMSIQFNEIQTGFTFPTAGRQPSKFARLTSRFFSVAVDGASFNGSKGDNDGFALTKNHIFRT
jgi:hypothetical protein